MWAGLLKNNRQSLLNRRPSLLPLMVAKIASIAPDGPPPQPSSQSEQAVSRKVQKKELLKQQRLQQKLERKAAMKEEKKGQAERERREWEEKLSTLSQEEKELLLESRKGMNKDRMEKRSEERERKILRLSEAKRHGQNIVLDLEFSHLMTHNEIYSLVRQIMYCYAVNGRSTAPAHLWLTGYEGEIRSQLQKLPGFDKWIIEKEKYSYINAFESQKEHLVYLTPDSETMLSELDPENIYVVGGLVDTTMRKGITMAKAKQQGIQTARLPILGNYLKTSSSRVLPVNQVIEILLKFLETKDWKASIFHVIPQRKRCEAETAGSQGQTAENDWKV